MSGATAPSRLPVGWALALLVGAAIALLVARAPMPTTVVVLALAAGAVLVREVGPRMAGWLVFVATISLREPLSVDLVGTKTLYLNDVILLLLFGSIALEAGVRTLWRENPAFRIGGFLVAASLLGLYGADLPLWAANYALGIAAQVAIFYVGWHVLREPRHARWTLLAFLAGMIPAVIVGIHQSGLPVGDVSFGHVPALAWDASGVPHVRIRSTYDHPLRFSLALSAATGMALGLMFAVRRPSRRLAFLLLAGLIVYCNQYTYSIGGLAGTAVALLVTALLLRRTWTLVALPTVLALWLFAAGNTLVHRFEQILLGENTSAMARWIGYTQAYQVLRDHPLFGVGWGNVKSAFTGDYLVSRDDVVGFTAENYFLQYAVALGLLGLGLTIALCVRFFRSVRTPPPASLPVADRWPQAAILIAGAAAWAQAQTFASSDYTTGYILWLILVLAERMRASYAAATPA